MKTGGLVKTKFVISLMKNFMDSHDNKVFLIDGFPRNQENIDVWNNLIGDSVDFQFVTFFKVEPEEMLKRILYRA